MADDQLQQMTLVYLFGVVYVYLDWYYDSSPIRGAKLAIALFATGPALVTLLQLARMARYSFFFLLNRTVDTLTLGTVMPLYSHYQEKYDDLKDRGVDEVYLQDLWSLPLPDEGKLWSKRKYFILYYCAGSWDGQCRIIRIPVTDIFNDCVLTQNNFDRREYMRITDTLRRDFADTPMDGDWEFEQSNDMMTSSQRHHNDPANIREYCFFIMRTKLSNSYTVVRPGGGFYMPVLRRNNPNRIEHQYYTVFCLSKVIRPHHLHLPLHGERRWIVCTDCTDEDHESYDSHFYYLNLLSDHVGDFINLTRLII